MSGEEWTVPDPVEANPMCPECDSPLSGHRVERGLDDNVVLRVGTMTAVEGIDPNNKRGKDADGNPKQNPTIDITFTSGVVIRVREMVGFDGRAAIHIWHGTAGLASSTSGGDQTIDPEHPDPSTTITVNPVVKSVKTTTDF